MGIREDLLALMPEVISNDDKLGLVSFFQTLVERAVSIVMDIEPSSDAQSMGSDFATDALGHGLILPLPYPVTLFSGRMIQDDGLNGRRALICEMFDDLHFSALAIYLEPRTISFSPRFNLEMKENGKPRWQVHTWPGYDISESDRTGENIGAEALSCLGILSMKQATRHETEPPKKLNAAREKKGLPAIGRVVVVRVTAPRHTAQRGGTHASPRPHWRRGHLRRLEDGRLVKVAPHAVMGSAPPPPSIIVKE